MKWIIVFFLVFSASLTQAQQCNFDHYYNLSAIAQQRFFQNNTMIYEFLEKNGIPDFRESIEIPVVVHILWRTPEQSVSDIQVYSQIEALNRDFSGQNVELQRVPSEFRKHIAKLQIQFCLVSFDPQGRETTGITRTRTEIKNIGGTQLVFYSDKGGKDAWDTNKYLNIWVCELKDGISGFGSLPNTVPQEMDGVIVNYKNFGTAGTATHEVPYNLGRTLTHEVGHYLNLLHPWGLKKGDCDEDDLVKDTPIQSNTYKGCPSYPVSSCGENEMTMNFMNEVDDDCMAFFTVGQKERMIASLILFRNGLLENWVCNYDRYYMAEELLVFPNPAKEWINLIINESSSASGSLEIYDVQGRKLITEEVLFNTIFPVDIRSLVPGLYFLKVTSRSSNNFNIDKLIIGVK